MSTAKDLMTIQTYINRWRDVEYRITLKKEKLLTLERLQSARKNIIENMKTFENNLVIKSVQYFVLSITPYKINLQRSLVKIDSMSWFISSDIVYYAELLRRQISTIESLAKVESIDELIPLFTMYLYLKQEIIWK